MDWFFVWVGFGGFGGRNWWCLILVFFSQKKKKGVEISSKLITDFGTLADGEEESRGRYS